jgi:tRNA G10  N-methylase Trm11
VVIKKLRNILIYSSCQVAIKSKTIASLKNGVIKLVSPTAVVSHMAIPRDFQPQKPHQKYVGMRLSRVIYTWPI